MITVRAGSAAIGVCLLLVTAGCSREQQDWRSAETADSIDSYGQFIQRHPDSELVTQARARVAQLGEDRDWQRAGSADTVDAYREFIAQHPNGKWAQEAHIRVENFSLGEQAGTDAGTKIDGAAGGVGRAAGGGAHGAATAGGGAHGAARSGDGSQTAVGSAVAAAGLPAGPGDAARSYGLAQPGEAATPERAGAPTPSSATGSAPNANSGATPSPDNLLGTRISRIAPATPAAAAGPGAVAAWTSSATAASSTSAGPGKGAFGIQLGAYSNEASASAQWRVLTTRYASELQGLQQHVVPGNTGSGRIYRLQATVGDEGRARAICDQLKKHGQACVAVLPH
jgi:hypothetical protein